TQKPQSVLQRYMPARSQVHFATSPLYNKRLHQPFGNGLSDEQFFGLNKAPLIQPGIAAGFSDWISYDIPGRLRTQPQPSPCIRPDNRIVNWNTGGLPNTRYREILVWLQQEHEANRPVDLCILLETAWREDSEFTASLDQPGAQTWHAGHSSGPDRAGILCLIRSGLLPASHLRYNILEPGRLVHLRLLFDMPMHILCAYQWAWNPSKLALQGKHRADAMTKQRRRIWQAIDRWAGSIPQRSTCLLLGDFNSTVTPEAPLSGPGVVQNQAHHPDQSAFQEILRARTYIPPNASIQHGSQIDFVIGRVVQVDPRPSSPALSWLILCPAPDAGTSLCAQLPLPRRPAPLPRPQRPRTVQAALKQPPFVQLLQAQVDVGLGQPAQAGRTQPNPEISVDAILLAGWQQTVNAQAQARTHPGHAPPSDTQLEPVSLTQQVRHMWATRTSLQTVSREPTSWEVEASAYFDNNAGPERSTRCPRRRLQLRAADGSLQTHKMEFDQIIKYFRALYDGPETEPPRLSQDLLITSAEILEALERFKPSKAMPSTSAPAALWKWFRQDIAPQLESLFTRHLCRDTSSLPRSWCTSELVLETGQTHEDPGSPATHLTTTSSSQDVQGPALAFLAQIPQYAYVAGRTLAQALERVIGHCASVRQLVQANACNIHGKRYGHVNAKLYGGCHLSLDISCAYDHVPWEALKSALQFAAVPQPLIEAILLVHHTALRTITTALGSVLQMHDPELLDIHRANTSYADDLHFGWTILCGRDLERAYAAMKHVLTHLLRQGLTISQDKTVVILELQGPQASKALDRYTVQRPTGRHFRFVIDEKVLHLKIVSQHVYLGAVIGFRKFEQETFKHRLALARNSFSRLSVILRNRTVPLKLRLQLWQGCIWPAMLHSLDCTGLPLKEFQSMQSQLIKQARSIAKSHSVLTKETNPDLCAALASLIRSPDCSRHSSRERHWISRFQICLHQARPSYNGAAF
ncbi:unnamed protein product, partial [Symbiodinium sp. CCMP2456]